MTTIRILFFVGGPSTIIGLIVAVVIDAIDTVFWAWTSSHIGKKINVVFPSFTYFDSSSSIKGVSLAIFIKASLAHATPDHPFRRVSFPMFMVNLAKAIFCPTSARYGFSFAPQVAAKNDNFLSTVTEAQKASISLIRIDKRENGQTSNALACEISDMISHKMFIRWSDASVN
jgi:hypothetical protein